MPGAVASLARPFTSNDDARNTQPALRERRGVQALPVPAFMLSASKHVVLELQMFGWQAHKTILNHPIVCRLK